MVTTLGSGVSGGSVYLLNLTKPLDFSSSAFLLHRRTLKVASFDCTMWTADCSRNGARAIIGEFFQCAFIHIICLSVFNLELLFYLKFQNI